MDAEIESVRETSTTHIVIATVDTNVLVSGVFFGGLPGKILTAAREGAFTFAMTPLLLNELREAFARKMFGLTPDMVQLLMEGFEDSAMIVYPDDDAVVTPRQFLDHLKIE